MTDREKLAKLLIDISYDQSLGVYDLLDMRDGAGYIADLLIANGVTVQEWISVKDRLPEKGTEVLAFDHYGRPLIAKLVENYYFSDGVSWYDRLGYYLGMSIITHWMPLPEPPKEETL